MRYWYGNYCFSLNQINMGDSVYYGIVVSRIMQPFTIQQIHSLYLADDIISWNMQENEM